MVKRLASRLILGVREALAVVFWIGGGLLKYAVIWVVFMFVLSALSVALTGRPLNALRPY